MKAELFYKSMDYLGEGALWHPSLNRLLWVDIERCLIQEIELNSLQVTIHPMPSMVSTIVPDMGDHIVVTLCDRIAHFDLATKTLTDLVAVETHLWKNRCNDGKCDPQGRLWFGTMSLDAKRGAGNLYSFGAGEPLRIKLPNQSIPNGIVWSEDAKSMYYIDTMNGCVNEYAYDQLSGEIEFRRMAVCVPSHMGSPDGMAIDQEGLLWIAHWGGSCVGCWNPKTGELIHKIAIPAPNVTSCAFGGPDGKTLFITTARCGLTDNELEQYPLSGSLFVCDELKTAGIPVHRFVR